MAQSHHRPSAVRTVRVNDEHIQKMICSLDAANATYVTQRQDQRFTFRHRAFTVSMQQPGASEAVVFQVITRDISATGMCFLHGGFVHVGTRCRVQLMNSHGSRTDVLGTVVRCAYIESGVHEVGIRFDQSVDPAQFSMSTVKLRTLVVEDEPLLLKLATIYLHQLNSDVESACDGQGCLHAAEKQSFDLILIDLELPDMSGFETVSRLRKFGYTGAVAAAASQIHPDLRTKCLAAGFDYFVSKPYRREELLRILEAVHSDPLYSSLSSDEETARRIHAFVAELPSKVQSIESATVAADLDSLLSIVRLLKTQAGAHGFEPISESSAAVEALISASKELTEINLAITRLVKLCSHARPTRRTPLPTTNSPAISSPETTEVTDAASQTQETPSNA